MKRLLCAVGVVMLLSGCASPAPSDDDAKSTPTPSPTPEYATENQVASVIATHESDWREVIDGAGECRALWGLDPSSLPALTCWIKEQTLGVTAETAIRDLGELEIPPSMQSLVASTTSVLQGIVDVNATAPCGSLGAAPADTPECSEARTSLSFYYIRLENELDAWRPYL